VLGSANLGEFVRLDYLHLLIKLSDFPPILPESIFLLKRLLDLLDLQEMIVFLYWHRYIFSCLQCN
jgi:hypothetical protein